MGRRGEERTERREEGEGEKMSGRRSKERGDENLTERNSKHDVRFT